MTFQELMNCYNFSDTENNRVVYSQLLEQLRQNNVTPLIGAGLSCWAYPLWSQLLTEQAKLYGIKTKIFLHLISDAYEEAASALEKEMSHSTFVDTLANIFNPSIMEEKSGSCPEYLKILPFLFHGPIVTTNFDHMIEYLYEITGQRRPDVLTPLEVNQRKKIDEAIFKQHSLILKLHGDIDNKENLVLTKNSYDNTYGPSSQPDLNRPMPNFLKKVLGRNTILFLGCGLNGDRTLSVIQACSESHRQIAFQPLTYDTVNPSAPYLPILRKNETKLKKKFAKRRHFLADMNISCIWYPSGMHAEAMEALLTQLAEDLKISLLKPSERATAADYLPYHDLIGRDNYVNDIVNQLEETKGACIWICAAPGMGKTEVCKKVNSILNQKHRNLIMPYIDLHNTAGLSAFYQSVIKALYLSAPMNLDADGLCNYLLDRLPVLSVKNGSTILYIDNFEDVWYSLQNSPKEQLKLCRWFRFLQANRVNILVSSRVFPPDGIATQTYFLPPLDSGESEVPFEQRNSVKLFQAVYGSSQLPAGPELESFKKLIYELGGYPLAIILAATKAKEVLSFQDLLGNWYEGVQLSSDEYHVSFEIALKMSWKALQKEPSALAVWKLLAESKTGEVTRQDFLRLSENNTSSSWNQGIGALIRTSLAYAVPEHEAVGMFLPIRKHYYTLSCLEV